MKKLCLFIAVFILFVLSCDNLYNKVAEEKKDMQRLVFINANGESVDLTSGNYGITEWSGFSNTELNLQTQQVPFHDGSVYLDGLLSERELSVTLAMNDENNLEKRYQLRRDLISILNPKLGEGTLIYTNDYTSKQIRCVPQIPIFENHNSNDSGTPKASLAWTACSPYWEDIEESSILFGLFDVVDIENTGDVPCPIKADIFIETCDNPTITQINTVKSISCQGEYEDIIRIDTADGNKSVMSEKYSNKILFGYNRMNDMIFIESKQIFLAIGEGVVFKSYDGKFWESKELTNSNFTRIIYVESKDLIVIVGENYIYTSSDAENWTERYYYGTWNAVKLNSVVYSSEKELFIAVGRLSSGGFVYGAVITSADGINWTLLPTLQGKCTDISYGNNIFVIVDNNSSFTSENGVDWIKTDFSSYFSSFDNVHIAYNKNNGRFCVVGNTANGLRALTSANGTDWIEQYIQDSTNVNYPLKWSEKLHKLLFVTITGVSTVTVYTSTNGLSWDISTTITSYGPLIYCDYPLGFLIYDYAIIKTTSDNTNWTEEELQNKNTYSIIDMTEDEKQIYLVGSDYIAISSDKGQSFNIHDLQIDQQNALPRRIYYNEHDDIFILIVKYPTPLRIFTSKNALDWSLSGSLINYGFIDFVYSDFLNKYVMITSSGANKRIFVSDNLSDWTQGDCENPQHVCNGKDKVIVSTTDGSLYYSENGLNYSPCTLDSLEVSRITNIIYDKYNDIYLACGYSQLPTQYRIYILKSSDGVNWTVRRIAIKTSTESLVLAYSREFNTYLVTLNDSTFFQSFDSINWTEVQQNNDNIITKLYYSEVAKMFLGCGDVVQSIDLKVQENLISNLTNNSDMTMKLEKGLNKFSITRTDGTCTCRITYRQKYIGV